MGEFDLIARYFRRPVTRSPLGIGDDCALLAPAPGMQLAVSTDLLVEGQHFFPTVDPQALGHKCLAVNLSDLAACGARPLAFMLGLSLPEADPDWLGPFAQGLLALADEHQCELVGGDTTRGPRTVSITIFGEVPVGQALLRAGARPGDEIWVSGHLGDARLGLEALRGQRQLDPAALARARDRLERPIPRVALGLALRDLAHAAIDLSDGLVGDLGHVLTASGVGATLHAEAVASLPALAGSLPAQTRLDLALSGGDDYELAFTAPASVHDAVRAAGRASETPVHCIGRIESAPGLRLIDAQGRPLERDVTAFDHFA